MKIKRSVVVLIAFLIGCKSNTKVTENNDSLIVNQVEKHQELAIPNEQIEPLIQNKIRKELHNYIAQSKELAVFEIDSASLYSERFISEVCAIDEIELAQFRNGTIILNQRDTVHFPEIPKLYKRTVFTAKKDDLAIALTLERINYTSIKYKIEMVA